MAVRTRLSTDERREQLIGLGEQLFSQRPFDEVSVEDIAARAGISAGLLYHYFGSKRGYYVAVVRAGIAELRQVIAVPAGPERTLRSLDAYLAYVEQHAAGYLQLMGAGIGTDPEVAAIVETLRREIAAGVLDGLRQAGATWPAAGPPPLLRHAVRGWVGAVEGASLDWVAHRDVPRARVCAFLGRALTGVLEAAIQADPTLELRLSTGGTR
jgi:AcrR family transcriptional regulator